MDSVHKQSFDFYSLSKSTTVFKFSHFGEFLFYNYHLLFYTLKTFCALLYKWFKKKRDQKVKSII